VLAESLPIKYIADCLIPNSEIVAIITGIIRYDVKIPLPSGPRILAIKTEERNIQIIENTL
jgi:hypothetical protein